MPQGPDFLDPLRQSLGRAVLLLLLLGSTVDCLGLFPPFPTVKELEMAIGVPILIAADGDINARPGGGVTAIGEVAIFMPGNEAAMRLPFVCGASTFFSDSMIDLEREIMQSTLNQRATLMHLPVYLQFKDNYTSSNQ